MNTANQIILTLREADTLARSQNPHHHRLAIVLLDNIIELQLRRKSEWTFALDRTTWATGVRKHDRKQRKGVSQKHADLLDLAVAEDWITEAESKSLAFAHRIRNRAYHEGDSEDEVDLQIGITLLYRIIRHRFPEWRTSMIWQEFPSLGPIPIENAASDPTGNAPLILGTDGPKSSFLGDEGWAEFLGGCLTYDDAKDIRPLTWRWIENLIDDVQNSLDYLTEDEKMNYVPVLARRFAPVSHVFCCCPKVSQSRISAVGALNIYMAVLGEEERLLDIPDEAKRNEEFHKLVAQHPFNTDMIASLDLDTYRVKAESVAECSEAEGIAQFLEIEKQLKKIGNAARECAGDLGGYIDFQIDVMRGK
jgi:hypothetical protein